MAAFNYRDLVRQVPPRSWQLYFKMHKLTLTAGADWNQSEEALHGAVFASFEALEEGAYHQQMIELRRIKALANRNGIQALCNAVPLGDAMLEDFQHHASDAERALWALCHWPQRFNHAESFLRANARIGKFGSRRIHLQPYPLHCEAEDISALRNALAFAFTPKKGRLRACEIDVLTRHLDGGVQLDIRIEDNLQRNLEFGPNDCTIWRDIRPPLTMTVILYPNNGVIDLLMNGGERARKKLLEPLGAHVLRQPVEPISVPQPMFLLNRLREGVWPKEHSGLDLHDHDVAKARLSECRVHANRPPACDYLIKPPGKIDSPDVLDCLREHEIGTLVQDRFDIIDAVVSLYFTAHAPRKQGRVLHIHVKPTGIANLHDMDEDDADLAEALLQSLGVTQPVSKYTLNQIEDTCEAF